MVQINLQQLRDHLSVFEPGYPLQKGYVAQLLFQHSLSDVFKIVKAIVTAAEPNKNLNEESLRTRLGLFKKFIVSRKNWLLTEWPTRIALLLEPFLITFKCPILSHALKSTPSAAISSQHPEQTCTQIPVKLKHFSQTLDTQIHPNLLQTPDSQIYSDLPQTPDSQIHPDLPQTPDSQIDSDFPQTPDTQIQSDNLQSSIPAQTAPPTQNAPPMNSQSCSATSNSQSPIKLKKSCASCVKKQRTNIGMMQENERLRHQLQDLKMLFRAENENFSLKRFNEKIRRKTESMMIWRNKYITLKASNDTQKLLDSVYSLEQKVKTLEEKLIATQEESLNMTSVIEQLKSMHEKTENYDAHLKYVSSYSPSQNAYTHTDVEENKTIMYNSQRSVCYREDVLSDRASKDLLINTKNMVEDVSYTQDVRSEEEKTIHIHTKAAESVIIIDYQLMMASIKNNPNDECSEELQQGRSSKLSEQGLSACQKITQQNVSNIAISSMNSLEEILSSHTSCQPSVLHVGKHHTIGNKCDSSGPTFKENIFQKHRPKHAKYKLYKCNVCGRRFAKDSLLKIHKRAHIGDKPYKCDVCGGRFAKDSHLKMHKRVHDVDKPYKHYLSGHGFSVKENLRMHTRTYTREKPFKCDVCGRLFSGSGDRDLHKRSHAGDRPYQCDFCGLCFTQKCSLEIHTRTHNSITQLKCKVCGLEFLEKADMKKHKKLHKGEKNCVCDICGQRFKRKWDLMSHNRKHTGEKPYQCDVCGRSFAQSCALVGHKRIHTEERPYKCDVCGFAFRHLCNLNSHKLIHTGEKPYTCDICGFQVNRKSNLRLHKKVHQKKIT